MLLVIQPANGLFFSSLFASILSFLFTCAILFFLFRGFRRLIRFLSKMMNYYEKKFDKELSDDKSK